MISQALTLDKLGATLWCSYSAFNLSYSMIYIPGTGIMSAYTGANSNDINPEFYQALAMYCWAWFIMNVLYTVAAIRSNWVLFLDLVVLDLAFLLLAVGYMTQSNEILKAGFSVLLVTAFLSCNILPPFLYLVIRSSR
jgi:succinate-acetate transporter protein